MKTIIFMDLDDSIFQTLRKCGDTASLRVGALGPDGTPFSFLRPNQAHLLDQVFKDAAIVPATGRNLNSFRRVTLDFQYGAILNFGGLVLNPAGEIDQEWLADIRPRCQAARGRLFEAQAKAEAFSNQNGLGCRIRLITDQEIDFYLQVKSLNGRNEELDEIRALFEEDFQDFLIYRNDNNLALLPSFLNKARALRFHLDKHLEPLGPDRLVLALGDSLADVEFMKLCDYMIIPVGSQLERRL